MFEIWACKEEPGLRLVTVTNGTLPSELGPRDWMRLGPFEADAKTAEAVRTHGYHFFTSDDPPLDPQALKNSNAAGA